MALGPNNGNILLKKLILIEGLFGSGKTTAAKNISIKLSEKGLNVKYYLEASQENPVGLKMSLEEADNTIKATTLKSYPYCTWENLSIERDSYMIIEARLIQNSSFWAMLNGEKVSNCVDIPQNILNSIPTDIDVKLIAFKQSSPERHINEVIGERKKEHPHWLPYICNLFENQRWSKINNCSGYSGFLEAQIEWSKLFPTIVDNLTCNKLVIIDPDANWDKTISKINNYLME